MNIYNRFSLHLILLLTFSENLSYLSYIFLTRVLMTKTGGNLSWKTIIAQIDFSHKVAL